MVFLRTLRKCKPLKYSPYKEEKKGTFKTTHRQVSSSSWIVSSSRASKSAGLIFSTRYGFVFYYVWTPRNNNIYFFLKSTICREMQRNVWTRRETVSVSGYRVEKSCVSPLFSPSSSSSSLPSLRLSPRPSSSVQWGHTKAADCAARPAPPMNQMRQVQLR